jgi:heme exporter protein A
LIELKGLTKSFGPRSALAGVDLAVGSGELVALVGPNGAGKTTLLRILATLTRPTSGTARVAGLDVARFGAEIRRSVGFLAHRTLLYEDLTAEQNLRFYARLYNIGEASARIDDLLWRVGLAARRHDLVRTFSHGLEHRLAIARSVLHCPQVLLLDEPYAGLDSGAVQMLTLLLAEFVLEGGTALLATHNLERALAVARRVVVLSRGAVVLDQSRTAIDASAFPEVYRALTAV